ncbi:MAG: hypothetical protein ACJ8G3_15205 [Burkholderiaceae bacterium]
MKTTTRYNDIGFTNPRQAGSLMALCAMLAGCGNQAIGDASRAPGANAAAYLLFPLKLGASPIGGATVPDALGVRESPMHLARQVVQANGMAPGNAAPSAPDRTALVARGINQTEQIVGSYTHASGEKHAFIWTASQGMRDLNDVVRNKPPELTLSDAVAISDAGAIVVQSNTGLVLLRPLSRPAGSASMPLGD